jgi:YfiH family protein
VSLAYRLGLAEVRFTDRSDGDMGHCGKPVHTVSPEVAERRRGVLDLPWRWLRQGHGDEVVRVDEAGAGAGPKADAAAPGCALAVLTADCAPVVLATPEGAVAVVHAGWRGLLAGVVARTVKELRGLGAGELSAVVGPCIHAECYEFGADQLAAFTDRFGPSVAGVTAAGSPALDLPAAVRAALAEQGVNRVDDVGICTACSPDHYSWRARRELERQAAVVWTEPVRM